MREVISLIGEICKRRKLIWDLSKADFKKRFVGSYFGMVWMFVQPVVTVLIYFCIFSWALRACPRCRESPMCCGWCRASCPGFSSARP